MGLAVGAGDCGRAGLATINFGYSQSVRFCHRLELLDDDSVGLLHTFISNDYTVGCTPADAVPVPSRLASSLTQLRPQP